MRAARWLLALLLGAAARALSPPRPGAGHHEDQGPGWAAKGSPQDWHRSAQDSPGQASELDRTRLSQDLGGGTLAIDTLPDNGTQVVKPGKAKMGPLKAKPSPKWFPYL